MTMIMIENLTMSRCAYVRSITVSYRASMRLALSTRASLSRRSRRMSRIILKDGGTGRSSNGMTETKSTENHPRR